MNWSDQIGKDIKSSKEKRKGDMAGRSHREKQVDKWYEKFKEAPIGKIFNGSKSNPKFGVANTFQKLVRLRAADENGICTCISCGIEKPWNQMHGGHFVKRENKATILHPLNVNPQCVKCNVYLGGNTGGYRKELVKRHGEQPVLELEATRLRKDHVWDRRKLAELKVEYLAEIKKHEKRIGLR